MIKTKDNKKTKVFVAMSGGVDSSVAAALLKEEGYDVVGITMCFNISYPDSKKPSCCGVEGIQDARRVAQILDIPHHVLNFASDIKTFIIDDFVDEYINGRTPNPCARCNQFLKFGTLYKKAIGLGADYIATGHYARVEYDANYQSHVLRKALDPKKDQSYFLFGLHREYLPHILFPLADINKEEVRRIARKYNLNTADKAESQDICFVPDSGYKEFIRKYAGDKVFVPGSFKNHLGEVVGEHKGILNYTIGQRDKLGIALGAPVYVYKIEKETKTVYVGPQEMLYAKGLMADRFNAVSIPIPEAPIRVKARIRYNAPEVPGTLTCLGEGRINFEFDDPQKSVTPGQSVVFYNEDIVLGGAVIDQAVPVSLNQEAARY